jgi:hypothetical protein
MQNGKWSVALRASVDLSNSAGLCVTDAGAIATNPVLHTTIGPLEQNAATVAVGELVFATLGGTTTCIAGGVIAPYANVMVTALGEVITHVPAGGNHALGRFAPELIDGVLPPNAAQGDEITVHIYAAQPIW